MYKQDLVSNNLHGLIYHKNQPNIHLLKRAENDTQLSLIEGLSHVYMGGVYAV